MAGILLDADARIWSNEGAERGHEGTLLSCLETFAALPAEVKAVSAIEIVEDGRRLDHQEISRILAAGI